MDYATKYLGQVVTIKMDRPIGAQHPKHPDLIYPINYGYIPGTIAPDGEGIDAFILGITEPLAEFTGVCIALIHRTNDDEDKLVVAPQGMSFTDEQIRELTYFQEKYYQSEIIRN